ncbi:hypothetical protein CRUP_016249 [Coryphaenoides rupestris]|nr:hypothetical protein CRUP_016249 [Coryphaenoides rupestris]
METVRQQVHKVLVHLSRENGAPRQDETQVSCHLEDNRFILSGGAGNLVPLKRPAFCPIKHLSAAQAAAIPLDTQNRGVDVGVAVLLQSANQRVLLTRRAASLRIFPGVWVPPELNDADHQILGLWESVYPPRLSRGSPARHHIVTYMLLHSPHTHTQLQVGLRPDPAEVSGCVWVDPDLARAIVSAVEEGEGEEEEREVHLHQLPPTISVTEVSPDGALRASALPVSVLCRRAPTGGPDVERVSTGTKFALELWLDTLRRQEDRSSGPPDP